MLHDLLAGAALGLGAAVPIGPMNIEMMRRNLKLGTPAGLAFGSGACLADITYLLLLSLGALPFLHSPKVLMVLSVVGAVILLWFGYGALSMKPTGESVATESAPPRQALYRHWLQAYGMTLFNPPTVLFWASVSAQVALLAAHDRLASLWMGLGVLLGTVGWVLSFNTILHHTRHRLSARVIHGLNVMGGLILWVFASVILGRVFWST